MKQRLKLFFLFTIVGFSRWLHWRRSVQDLFFMASLFDCGFDLLQSNGYLKVPKEQHIFLATHCCNFKLRLVTIAPQNKN